MGFNSAFKGLRETEDKEGVEGDMKRRSNLLAAYYTTESCRQF
jgi:hypothetical protein